MFQAQIGLNRKLRISAFLAGAFLFVLINLALFPLHTKTETTSATTKQSETVMTLSTEDLTLDFEVASVDGSFADDTASVSVTTNNATGYTLSINTSNTGNNAGKLVGENNSFNPISSATTETDFTNSASYNGLWGYKPSVINGAANNSYLPVPTETTTIEETNVPNQEANVYEISLGARADMSYEADTYTNAFIITSVANPVGYTINYNENTEDEVTGMPASQTGSTTASTITLSDATPERENYEFLGWCDGETTTTSNIDSCADTIYQPGDEYEIDHLDDDTETELNAMWKATAQRYTVNYVLGENNTNTVVYKFNPITEAVAYSHTPNITDEGVQNGNYSNNMSTNEVVTIPGATKLHIRLTYAGESTSCDWTSIWAGSHPDYTAAKNYSIGVRIGGNTDGKYGGGSGTTIEGDVETEDGSVTFGFRSDNSVVGFGYYAVITVVEGDGYFYNGEAFSGVYSENVGQNNVFLGWSDTENDTEVVYASEDDIISAADFGVTNTVNIYPVIGYPTNISFNANGGTGEMNGTTIPYGTTANLPALTYDNYSYKFMGWDTEQEGTGTRYADTAEFTATTQAGENVTLYAQWQEVQIYTVHYVDRGETNTVNYASWHTGAGSSIHYSHTPNISDEGIQSGNYANNYAMTDVVNVPGATRLHVSLTYGGEGISYDWVSLWPGEHTDYTAYNNYSTGLRLGSNTSGKYGGTQGTVEGDIDGDSVTFAFRSDGSGNGYGYYAIVTATDIVRYTYSGSYVQPVDDIDVFLGWNTDPDATTVLYKNEQEFYDTYDGANEITLYAIWGKPTTIIYNANGTDGEDFTEVITYGEHTNAIDNMYEKENYEFLWWDMEPDNSGTKYKEGATITATAVNGETITLYAIWAPVSIYKVHYIDRGETNTVEYASYHNGAGSQTYYSHTPNINDEGIRDGNYANNYNMTDVIASPDATRFYITLTYASEGISYDWVSLWAGNYPNYTASNYNTGIRLGNNTTGKYGGTQETVSGYIDGDAITFAFRSDGSGNGYGYYAVMVSTDIIRYIKSGQYIPPTDDIDVFLGWNTDPDATTVLYKNEQEFYDTYDGANEITLYAIWGKPTTIIYNANGGVGEMEPVSVTYGTSINLATNLFSRDGYSFVKWSTEPNGAGKNYRNESPFKAIAVKGETINIYAIWEPKQNYTIHFVDGENTNDVVYECHRSGTASEPLYSHTPNILDDGTQEGNYDNNMSTNDIVTMDGVYKLHIALTYGGESIDYVSIWEGNHPDYRANSHSSSGVRFTGNTNGQYGGGSGTTASGFVNDDTATFSFYSDRSNTGYGYYAVITPGTICNEDEIDGAYTDLEDENNVFLGWNKNPDAMTATYTSESAAVQDLHLGDGNETTLYAIWGKPTFVSFDANGGTGEMDTVQVTYNTTVSLPEKTITKENAVFVKWNTKPDGTGANYNDKGSFKATNMRGDNITLYAIWGEQTIIHFNANVGGVGTMEDIAIDYNTSANLPANTFTKREAVFVKWSTNPNGTGASYNDTASYKATVLEGTEVTLYAIWAGSTIINYDGNGGNGSINEVIVPYQSTTTISDNRFTREGYTFLGWNTAQNGSGMTYAENSTFTASVSSGEFITMYAMWIANDSSFPISDGGGVSGITIARAFEIAYTAQHKGMYEEQHEGQGDYALVNSWPPYDEPYKNYDVRFAMQDMTHEICASVTVMNDDYRALDIRDNKLYHITKTQDGNCWMTQNLDLDLSPDKPLTSLDTDLNAIHYNLYENGYEEENGIIKWTPYRATAINNLPGGWNCTYWSYVYCSDYLYSTDVGNWYWTDQWHESATYNYLQGEQQDKFSQTMYEGNKEHGHVGNYYDFAAATASNVISSASGDQLNSICPKGWKLPIRGDFGRLYSAYSDNTSNDMDITAEPLYFVRAGSAMSAPYSAGSFTPGSSGNYHTATPSASQFEYRLGFSSSGVNVESYDGRLAAGSVRCLAR